MTPRTGCTYSRIQNWTAGALLTLLTLSLAVLFSATRLNAQSQNSIHGTVADSTG